MTRARVAVIGAGWAGLACASELVAEADVVVYEAGQFAGGRARALAAAADSRGLDNGQHLLIGAYEQVLQLLARCGMAEDAVFQRLPLTWFLADGVRLKALALPTPFHVLGAVFQAKGWSRSLKWAFLNSVHRLKGCLKPTFEDVSVASWLQQQRVPHTLVRDFWQPLVLATLNTPVSRASVVCLARVVQDGVVKNRAASDFLLPKCDLGHAWVAPMVGYVKAYQGEIRYAHRVRGWEYDASNCSWVIDGEAYDAVMVATAPYHAQSLIAPHAPDVASQLAAFEYGAITTVYLDYAETVRLPESIVGFAEGTVQWLVDRTQLGFEQFALAATISVSHTFKHQNAAEWVAAVHQDVVKIMPHLKAPIASQVVTEKRATVLSEVGRERIQAAALNQQNIYLAGDYMHPVYPATLEGAVQTGQLAAAQFLADWKSR